MSPAAIVLLLLLAQHAAPSYCVAHRRRKPYCTDPRSPCWPTPQAWQALNTDVHGNLLSPAPPASPCFNTSPNFDPQACREAYINWLNPFWRSQQPGAMQNPNWEGFADETCGILPDSTTASTICHQGAVPVHTVEARHASHVQAVIKFASRHNLRVAIKTTGHDYMGRSTAPGSLGLWMHRFKNISFLDFFTPEGCHDIVGVPAVTAGVGVTWGELYLAANAQNRVVVGGSTSTVSNAGGFLQGGGHGALSPLLGLSADNVLEIKLVTADGTVTTTNRCQNEDLFWALRGGGGGTFGVVLSATHKTHPALSSAVYLFYVVRAKHRQSFVGLINEVINLLVALSEADVGWSGYTYVETVPYFYTTLAFLLPNRNAAMAEEAFLPITNYVKQNADNISFSNKTVHVFNTFQQWHTQLLCTENPHLCADSTGIHVIVASRLLPKWVLKERALDLARAIVTIVNSSTVIKSVVGHFVAGGAVARVDADTNAVNPAWRQALWHVLVPTEWLANATLQERLARAKLVSQMGGLLRDVSPGAGAYLNEADPNEPNWQEAFFGCHYPRLLRIKQAVDPSGLFYCKKCVGSENFDVDDCAM